MAYIKLLIISCFIAVVCADFNWYGQQGGFSGFGQNGFNIIPTPPPLPIFGQQFPNFPSLPNIKFPIPTFPTLNFPPTKFPSGVDISKKNPAPGETYNGIAVQSVSVMKKDKDGNLIKDGGTTIITNQNGEVNTYETGNSPPKMDEPIVYPTFRPSRPIQFPSFSPPDFSKIKPSDNAQYSSISSSSFSSSSDNNGVKKSGGILRTSIDVNGEKQENSYIFGDGI